jgi:hypothetical protein
MVNMDNYLCQQILERPQTYSPSREGHRYVEIQTSEGSKPSFQDGQLLHDEISTWLHKVCLAPQYLDLYISLTASQEDEVANMAATRLRML